MFTQAITAHPASDFAADVRAGLTRPGQKELPSKYLYDEVGSALFEVITVLPEYGLTRAGLRLFQRHAHDIVERLPRPVHVAELGSGSGKKTRIILEALVRRQPATYYPIDISRTALQQAERELAQIDAVSVVGFERAYLDGLLEVAARRRAGEHILVLFLGSTIGNFDRPAGEEFLRAVRNLLQPDDCLLLSTDLEKPIPQLLLAYDDPLGVTAAFNLNLLARINRELDGDFDLLKFQHVARYDEAERRIEMHIRSREHQKVHIRLAGLRFSLRQDETIWTESSHKYNTAEVAEMAARSRFRCTAQWVDQEWPFATSLLAAV
jgi:dimethylhistidine N-methyltransferase